MAFAGRSCLPDSGVYARQPCLLHAGLMHRTCITYKQHLPDLNSKLVVVCMLCQADLSCTANVLEVALECLVDLLDSAQKVRVPLILQKDNWHDVKMHQICCTSMRMHPCHLLDLT